MGQLYPIPCMRGAAAGVERVPAPVEGINLNWVVMLLCSG